VPVLSLARLFFATLTLCLCILAPNSLAQESAGSTPDDPTEAQRRHDNVFFYQISPLLKEYNEFSNRFQTTLGKRGGNMYGPNVDVIKEFISGTEAALDFASNIDLESRALEIKKLYASIDMLDSQHSSIKSQLEFLRKQVADAYKNIEKSNKKAEEKEVETAEKDIEAEDDFWSGEDSEPVNESKANDDDFWAGEAVEEAKNSISDDDFWAGETASAGSDSDFWDGAESNDSIDFEIKTKGNTQGVVSNSGKVLIPFKNWTVLSYKNGLANVIMDRKRVNSDRCEFWADSWYFNVSTYKKGITDKSGQLLIEPVKFVSGHMDMSKGVFLGAGSFDYETYKRNRRIKSRECKINISHALERSLNSYLAQGYKKANN